VSRVGNYIADRQQLSDMVEEHQRVIKVWDEHVEELNQMRNNVNNYIYRKEMQKIENELEKEREEKEKVLEFWNGMAQADYDAKRNFQTASEGFITIFSKLDTLTREIGKTNGNLEKLNVNEMQDLIFKDNLLVEMLLKKMGYNGVMSEAEREFLFQYLQNDFLDNEMLEEIEEIVDLILTDDVEAIEEGLMNIINNRVLKSDESLEMEMAKIQAYLFMGNLTSHEFAKNDLEEEVNEILHSYLKILENCKAFGDRMKYETGLEDLNEMNIKVEIDYEKSSIPVSHIFKQKTRILGPHIDDFDETTVTYYSPPGAVGKIKIQNNKELKESLENFTFNQGANELYNKIVDEMIGLTGKFALPIETGSSIVNILSEKDEIKNTIKNEDAEIVADRLKMAVIVSEQDFLVTEDDLKIVMVPTMATFELIERWEKAHELNSEIPFPSEQVNNRDWYAISEFYINAQSTFSDYDGLDQYIHDDSIRYQSVEEMAEEW
jgi:uncharacterized protein YukE